MVVYDVLSPEMDSLYFSDQTCCIFLIREFNDDGERVMNESTAMHNVHFVK